MRRRNGVVANRFDVEVEGDAASWSPSRLLLALGSVGNVIVGLWLLTAATEADGAWSVGWRFGLAVLLGIGALVFFVSSVLGIAGRRSSIS